MKYKLISFITLCIVTMSHAQETNSETQQGIAENLVYKNSIRMLPLNTIFGSGISFEYEHVIKKHWTLNFQAFGQYYTTDIFRNGLLRTDGSIYEARIEIGARYYVSRRKPAPKGWFIGSGIIGGFRAVDFDESNNPDGGDYNTFLIGGSIKSGYQWIFKSGFTLGLAGGANGRFKFSGPNEPNDFGPLLEFSIGYSW